MPRNNVNNNKAPNFIEFCALSSFDLWTFKKKNKSFDLWFFLKKKVLTYDSFSKKKKVLTYDSFSKKKKVLTYGSFSKKKSFDFMEDGGYLFIFYDNSDKNKWADVPMSQ